MVKHIHFHGAYFRVLQRSFLEMLSCLSTIPSLLSIFIQDIRFFLIANSTWLNWLQYQHNIVSYNTLQDFSRNPRHLSYFCCLNKSEYISTFHRRTRIQFSVSNPLATHPKRCTYSIWISSAIFAKLEKISMILCINFNDVSGNTARDWRSS